MQLFYHPDTGTNGVFTLKEDESKHAVRVLRLVKGDKVSIIDGKGNWYETEILEPNPKKCILRVISVRQDPGKNHKLHIAIAPVKNNERFEWFLEKATEIGIDEITPVIARHSERKSVNPERCEKILVSAIKQSLKATLPKFNSTVSFTGFLDKAEASQKFIAHCAEGEKILFRDGLTKNSDALILIGPEGDFATEEIELAINKGFKPVSLGGARLRTETAGIVAAVIVNQLNE